jgi:hypothetical protein
MMQEKGRPPGDAEAVGLLSAGRALALVVCRAPKKRRGRGKSTFHGCVLRLCPPLRLLDPPKNTKNTN